MDMETIRKIFAGLIITAVITLLSGCKAAPKLDLVEPLSIDWCKNGYANKVIGYYNARFSENPIKEENIKRNETKTTIIYVKDDVFYIIEDNGGIPYYTVAGYSELSDENRKEFFEYADRLSVSSICFFSSGESEDIRQGNDLHNPTVNLNGEIKFNNGDRVQRHYAEYEKLRSTEGNLYVMIMTAYEIPEYMPSPDSNFKLLD